LEPPADFACLPGKPNLETRTLPFFQVILDWIEPERSHTGYHWLKKLSTRGPLPVEMKCKPKVLFAGSSFRGGKLLLYHTCLSCPAEYASRGTQVPSLRDNKAFFRSFKEGNLCATAWEAQYLRRCRSSTEKSFFLPASEAL